jgi:hypothetical protein
MIRPEQSPLPISETGISANSSLRMVSPSVGECSKQMERCFAGVTKRKRISGKRIPLVPYLLDPLVPSPNPQSHSPSRGHRP